MCYPLKSIEWRILKNHRVVNANFKDRDSIITMTLVQRMIAQLLSEDMIVKFGSLTIPLPLGLAPPSLLVWLQSPPSLRLGLSSGSAPLAPTPPAGPRLLVGRTQPRSCPFRFDVAASHLVQYLPEAGSRLSKV